MSAVEKHPVYCLHENDWGALKVSVENLDKRINGSLMSIQKHMDDGRGWRMSIIGLVFAIIVQIVTFAFMWGGLAKQVEINTHRWEDLKICHPEVK
jgi:hypothetical protein